MSKIIKVLLLLVGLSLPSSATAIPKGPPPQELLYQISIYPVVVVAVVQPSSTPPEDSSIEMNFTAGDTGAAATALIVQDIFGLHITAPSVNANATQ